VVWSPTSVYLTITFRGRKAHAGVEPEKGISAVQVAAQAVAAMQLDRQLALMRVACEQAAEAWGATVEFATEEIYQTYRIAEDAQPYREAAAAIRSLGLEVSPRKSGGGTDGNYFNAKGIPCVALPTGMVDEHATSEHIAIDDMVLACQTLVAIVTQPAEGDGKS
jgi:tripeptide aminopeptidase